MALNRLLISDRVSVGFLVNKRKTPFRRRNCYIDFARILLAALIRLHHSRRHTLAAVFPGKANVTVKNIGL